MKTIGLIGGMSWQSTAIYYRLLNEMARDALGGLHSAKLVMWSFDFAEIEALQEAGAHLVGRRPPALHRILRQPELLLFDLDFQIAQAQIDHGVDAWIGQRGVQLVERRVVVTSPSRYLGHVDRDFTTHVVTATLRYQF